MLCIVLCSLLVVAILVCILPFPERICLSLQAEAYRRNNVVHVKTAPITVEGYRLHYLLREDKMILSLNVDGLQISRESGVVYDLQRDAQYVIFSYYDSRIDGFTYGKFIFNDAFTDYAITVGDSNALFYVASIEPGADLQELAREFQAAGLI